MHLELKYVNKLFNNKAETCDLKLKSLVHCEERLYHYHMLTLAYAVITI